MELARSAGLTDRAAAVARLADGRILVAGSTTSSTTGRDSYVVSRRLANGQADNPCTAADALEALRIAEAAGRSWRERRSVALAEIA